MRKLSGAKDKLSLRVHGLIIGSPEKKRADPAVLRSLCTNYLPNGKIETLISEFSNWKSVQVCQRAVCGICTCVFHACDLYGCTLYRVPHTFKYVME